MRFIHISDVHLGMQPEKGTSFSTLRQKEIYKTFYRLLDKVKEEAVDFLLITGDLFHRQPSERELKELDYKLCQLAPTKVIMIAGNHDYINDVSGYKHFAFSKNVYMIKESEMQTLVFEDEKTMIYGLSYHDYIVREALYNDVYPERDHHYLHILLAHGGDEKHIPIDFKALENAGFDYVALGHIHEPKIFQTQTMAYAGVLEPIDRTCLGERGYIDGECRLDRGTKLNFIPFSKSCYSILNINIEDQMTYQEILDTIKMQIDQYGDHYLYLVHLWGYRSIDVTIELEDIMDLGYIVEIKDMTKINSMLYYEQNKHNILGAFINEANQRGLDDKLQEKVLDYGLRALSGIKKR